MKTTLKQIEQYLERTAWGRGVYTKRFQVPGARPAQIRAGARKVMDQLRSWERKGTAPAV